MFSDLLSHCLPGLQKLQHAEGFTLNSKGIQSLHENGFQPLTGLKKINRRRFFDQLSERGAMCSHRAYCVNICRHGCPYHANINIVLNSPKHFLTTGMQIKALFVSEAD